jgi:hypothetical protein
MLVCNFFAGNLGFVQMPGGCFVAAVNIATSPWILCFTAWYYSLQMRGKRAWFRRFCFIFGQFLGLSLREKITSVKISTNTKNPNE